MTEAGAPTGPPGRAAGAKPDPMAKRMEKYCKTSLGMFDRSNCFRRSCVRLVEWPWFDRIILVLILANSVVLALTDYGTVDAIGEPSTRSWRNNVVDSTELFFTAAFSVECVLKVICMGFVRTKGTYLRDGWNVLDFVVVVTGLLASFPDIPNVSAFRTVRVLRPLRSLTVVPEMQKLVMSLLGSIPALLNVVVLLMFVFAIFGILGVQLWSGELHARCRMTQFPVKMIANCDDPLSDACYASIAANGTTRCLPNAPNNHVDWTQDSSPWSTPQDCFWPVVFNDTRVCSLGGAGRHSCASGTFCGSDYDEFGNARFSSQAVMERSNFFAGFNWGYTHFDHIAVAFVTIFQVITMEGWVDVMYMVGDSHNAVVAAIYFVFLVLFGSFFLLNLTLAVIWDNFGGNKELDELILERRASELADTIVAAHAAFRENLEVQQKRRSESQRLESPDAAAGSSVAPMPSDQAAQQSQQQQHAVVAVEDTPEAQRDGKPVKWWLPATKGALMHRIVSDKWFSALIILLIIINTVVLASDHHPMEAAVAERLEIVNFVLTMLFTIEMLMKGYGLGLREYARDPFNLFDCFIVLVSLIEMVVLPPGFLTTTEGDGGGGGAISALRTFRLFRVFKLARDWRSLNILLKTIVKTLADIANFAVLLLLFMYIFSLVGMQFFANTFCFDPVTGLADTAIPTGVCAAGFVRPRAHFDDLLWAFVTIFQILTGENWNTVMYDGCRAGGWPAVLYFIGLVVLGNFIVLNLFLAILLGNFEGMEALSSVEEEGGLAGAGGAGSGRQPPESTARKICRTLTCRGSKQRVAPAGGESGDGTPGAGSGTSVQVRPKHHRGEMEIKNLDAIEEDSKQEEAAAAARGVAKQGDDSMSLRSVTSRPNMGQAEGSTIAAAAAASSSTAVQPPLPSPGAGVGAGAGSAAAAAAAGPGSAAKKAGVKGGAVAVDSKASSSSASMKGDSQRGLLRLDMSRVSEESGPGIGIGIGSGSGSGNGSSHHHPHAGRPRGDSSGSVLNRSLSEKRAAGVPVPLPPLLGNALWVFSPTNAFRTFVAALVRHPVFDNIILALIFLSSVVLALDNPLLDPNSLLVSAIKVSDLVFTIAFTVEMVLKMVTWGFLLNHKDSYLRSGWNQLDFVIVLVSILSMSASGSFSSLRSLRTLRALRPLRVISRRPGLRLVVNALFSSMKSIANVLFVCVLFFLIFGIVGVNYFKGAFMECGGDAYDELSPLARNLIIAPRAWDALAVHEQALFSGNSAAVAEFQTTFRTLAPNGRTVCGYLGADWQERVPQSFDNIFSAMGTLFEMSTTEGWVDVMYAGVDCTGVDSQPVRDHGWGWVFFFMAFMVVGSFFVMNLFVGVVIDNFNTMKDRLGGNYLLTEAQKEWVKTQERLMRNVPKSRRMKAPPTPVRRACYNLIMQPWFDYVIMACIILNTVVMSARFFGESTSYTDVIEIINYVFAAIFTIEAAVKLIALHTVYFKDSWNVFDFLIVLGTNIGLILKVALNLNIGSIATIIRTFRVGRIFRLIKSAKSLRQLFQTLVLTLPSLGNIGGLLFLLFFIYAVMGVQLFAEVQLQTYLNVHANFQSFTLAIVTLMRASTGESWNYIMYEMATDMPGCTPNPTYNADMCGYHDVDGCQPINGCGDIAAFPFFISFTLFVTFVFLNLFIAVILEGFSESGDEAEAKVTDDHLQQFYELWEKYDGGMERFIHTSDMEKLVQELEEPLGFGAGVDATPAMLQQRLAALQLPVYTGNRVYLKDVVRALVGRHFNEEAIIPMDHKINKEWRRKFPSPRNARSGFLLHNYYAALSIQNSYQAYKFRKSIDSRIDEKDGSKRVPGRKDSGSDDDDV